MTKRTIKAVALMSGGLDSMLAAKLIVDQGVEVLGLHLSSPFACQTDIYKCAEQAGVKLFVREKGEAYLDLMENPKYGYGKAINPCLDCRIFMFDLAEAFMKEQGADFILTGEVVGQRPMSQRREAMDIIDTDSDTKGLILRPLSARSFPETVAEKEGWIDREKLLGITGRGRTRQLELATELGLTEFGAPGGGCLLTERGFAPKMRDFFDHEDPKFRKVRSELLRHGRHFRLSDSVKLILGRNADECDMLRDRWKVTNGVLFDPVGFQGPAGVAFGSLSDQDFETVASVLLRYSKFDEGNPKEIAYQSAIGAGSFTGKSPATNEILKELRI